MVTLQSQIGCFGGAFGALSPDARPAPATVGLPWNGRTNG